MNHTATWIHSNYFSLLAVHCVSFLGLAHEPATNELMSTHERTAHRNTVNVTRKRYEANGDSKGYCEKMVNPVLYVSAVSTLKHGIIAVRLRIKRPAGGAFQTTPHGMRLGTEHAAVGLSQTLHIHHLHCQKRHSDWWPEFAQFFRA